MLLKAVNELLGAEVLACDGEIGELEDFYFDCDSWKASYLLVYAYGARLVVPTSCIAAAMPALQRVALSPSYDELCTSAGVWPYEAASRWLQNVRVCSARQAAGLLIQAEDGPAGRVSDLLIDDETWAIQYIVAATGQGWRSPQVLFPLEWVAALELRHCRVRVRRSRAELSAAPRVAAPSPRSRSAKG